MAKITYTINDSKLDEFKTGFFVFVPVPTDANGKPEMTENQWIRQWGKMQFLNAYKKGKMMLAHKAVKLTKDIIE